MCVHAVRLGRIAGWRAAVCPFLFSRDYTVLRAMKGVKVQRSVGRAKVEN